MVLRALFSGIEQCAGTADMCRTLAATVSAGIAINKALPFAANTCGNHYFQRAVRA